MTYDTTTTKALAALHDAIAGLTKRERVCAEREATAATLPASHGALLALLEELAAAETDCNDHHRTRFRDEAMGREWDAQSEECRADWTRCHRRREAAISRVVAYALAVSRAATERSAAE